MSWELPAKTEWMKSQLSHKPSMDYAKDIYKVIKEKGHRHAKALEIGGAWGFSTLAILEANAEHLTTVDNNVKAECENEAKANGYENYNWLQMPSREYWATHTEAFNLIYVDGSHLYADVCLDLAEAWERLLPSGMILVDDWDHKKNIQPEDDTTEYGVSLACWEFWRDHAKYIKQVGIEGRVLWFKI